MLIQTNISKQLFYIFAFEKPRLINRMRNLLKWYLLCISVLIININSFSAKHNRKIINAERITSPPIIDGKINDAAWKEAKVGKDFIQLRPYNGQAATQKTEVMFIYDDQALYIAAKLFDTAPDSIYTELSKRDEIGMVDNFGVQIDPFNDAKVAYGFYVTAAGVQVDMKLPQHNQGGHRTDNSWDAVWSSATRITKNGWIVEMKIPYSALRFPRKEVQSWGVNVFRNIKRNREVCTWNFIDQEIAGTITQSGELQGIEDIMPPIRLSAVPYLSGLIENNTETEGWGKRYAYGIDLKYGINESFTLDMTLIPDFSQVQSDDKIVNLSPFETFYSEKRPFFTEGTELFRRGNRLFYSRRIGSQPINYREIYNNYAEDDIISNPENTQLINSSKISGKTKSGFGIGIFNSMTAASFAEVRDELGNIRQVQTQPFTNYSMVVIDQSLKNNSFVSFYNTNVYRGRNEYSANVTGTEFKFENKENTYALEGRLNISQKYCEKEKDDLGYNYMISLGKISGNFRMQLTHNAMNETYDHNDLGFLNHNNYFSNSINLSHHIFKPFWKVMNWTNGISITHSSLYVPRSFTTFRISAESRTTFRNYTTVSLNTSFSPFGFRDYFEPRVDGWMYDEPGMFAFKAFISPDYRKKFLIDWRFGSWQSDANSHYGYFLQIAPRIRFNDKFIIVARFNWESNLGAYGYVTDSLNTSGETIIIFGKRDVKTLTNTIDLNYIFNNKSSLSFRIRHYWIRANYNDYYDLQKDGSLIINDYLADNDFNFNAFNIDMVYTWNFAPGSELLLVWKNAIDANIDNSVNHYFDNLQNTFNSPMTNNFSIKVLYYIDYITLRGRK